MALDVNLNLSSSPDTRILDSLQAVQDELQIHRQMLGMIISQLNIELAKEDANMADMSAAIAALRTEVERNRTVDESVMALVHGISAQLEQNAGNEAAVLD